MIEVSNQYLLERIKGLFPDAILHSEESYGMLSIEVPREHIIEVLQGLRDDAKLEMKFLTDLCAVHYPDNVGKELGVVYHLHSFSKNARLRIKTFFPIQDPKVASATSVFAAANWMERESYDFFGVIFEGHPDLRRILNVDVMDYHPLRKEYPLEDATRTDKDDRFFGRDGNRERTF